MEESAKYKAAMAAIRELFGDTSASQEETAEVLRTLIMEIQDLISSLDV